MCFLWLASGIKGQNRCFSALAPRTPVQNPQFRFSVLAGPYSGGPLLPFKLTAQIVKMEGKVERDNGMNFTEVFLAQDEVFGEIKSDWKEYNRERCE